jgi:hypothetical protein
MKKAPLFSRPLVSAEIYLPGLNALEVSRRCSFLREEKHGPLLWMLQQRSWQPGGLRALAEELVAAFPSRVPYQRFTYRDVDALGWLHRHLERACTSPSHSLDPAGERVWGGDFIADLEAYRRGLVARAAARLCPTEVTLAVHEALDYAQASPGSLTLCFGPPGVGKSAAARNWCEQRPGVARYIETPAVENERGFYSAVAEELGIPRGAAYNGQQTSLKIIDVLKTSRLTLVLDEAQRLWPQRKRPAQTPMRLLWLTTLVNAGVPVGLVALPEFFRLQRALVKASGWSDAQFNRRLAMVKELPVQISETDLRRVACHHLPEAAPDCHELLVRYAQASKVNLSAITETIRAARFLARKSGRAEATFTDLQDAVAQIRAPMDWLLAADPIQLCADG